MRIGYLIITIILAVTGFILYKFDHQILSLLGFTAPQNCLQAYDNAQDTARCISSYNKTSLALIFVSCGLLGGAIGGFAATFIKKKSS
ncbi:MAG: hypothetical protein ACK5MJ_03375 [Alphaproteobacteria bacterium]